MLIIKLLFNSIAQGYDSWKGQRTKSQGLRAPCCWLFGWSNCSDSHLPHGGNIHVMNVSNLQPPECFSDNLLLVYVLSIFSNLH